MTRDKIFSELDRAFGQLSRPSRFIRGTCACDECREHEATMQSLVLPDLPLAGLDNPGWDPICFASDEAFAYLVPGLVRLVLNHTADYIDQFLFHIDSDERVAAFSADQCRALLFALDYLFLNEAETLKNHGVVEDLLRARERLEPPA
jgi:hypothetical protein